MNIKDKIHDLNIKGKFNARFNPRSLDQICHELEPNDFSEILQGTMYCMLKPKEYINCKYRATEPDLNGLYMCNKYGEQTEVEYR